MKNSSWHGYKSRMTLCFLFWEKSKEELIREKPARSGFSHVLRVLFSLTRRRDISMMWTTAQEDTLRELGHLGVDAVQGAIESRHGTRHSLHSIEMHASRIHVSLKVRSVCPECGAVGVHLNRQTGLCPRCSELFHLEEEKAFNELLEAERRDAEDGPEIEKARRKYAALRQRNARLCHKYNLRSKRERE